MENKTIREIAVYAQERWGSVISEKIRSDAAAGFKEMCFENRGECRAKKAHLKDEIFPCISFYDALKKNGIDKNEALEFLDESLSRRAGKSAESMKKVLRFCGLYKLYPLMFRIAAEHSFGHKAGFEAEFYKEPKTRCRFDMKKCLYMDTCCRYGCPELTVCFCHTDDINNADLHPELCWARTKFMGKGDKFCDFDIYVRDR